ncbi:MAG: tRNA 2-thiouridine(34) synthase MnmA [Nitrospirales bacterium]|nr:tRNA 2-thiouridine(34) synthase MnmA [Nitrospirales bacterium]
MSERSKKVIVGMSGGVDSSVTAYLLQQEGYEVEGLSFVLYEARMRHVLTGCCSLSAIDDAGRTAGQMGIPHTALDLRDEFMEKVIEPFIDAYSRGFTPNPCVLCNRRIKFPYLLKMADERGAGFIATGHYAIVDRDSCQPSAISRSGTDEVLLKKGVDPRKDQSYFLAMTSADCIKRLLLPLGGMVKDEVRRIAREQCLPSATRPESQEICFVDGNYTAFLEGVAGGAGGPVVHALTGAVLGRHPGIHLFTIGQRKRLGVSSPDPLYVVRIDPSENTVYVGPRDMVMMRELIAEEMNWLISDSELSRLKGLESFSAKVKMRSTMKEAAAVITLLPGKRVRVVYDQLQWAPAPGQTAVIYDNDRVLGGGVISSMS